MKKQNKIKAILIDATNKTVTEVEVVNDFQEPGGMYELIKTDIIEQMHFGMLHDVILVDEEGTYRKDPKLFTYKGCQLYGNGLIVGTKPPNYVSYTISIEEVKKNIIFL